MNDAHYLFDLLRKVNEQMKTLKIEQEKIEHSIKKIEEALKVAETISFQLLIQEDQRERGEKKNEL